MLIAAEIVLVLLWFRMAIFCVLGIVAWRKRQSYEQRVDRPDRISAIVPALDEEETIALTLLSLLNHDPAPWEIIVVDDGSSDSTAEIAHKSLAGFERAKIIELPANVGKAAALNVGIRAASCDLIATIDADTRLEPGALSAALAALSERGADAIAFYVDVDNRFSALGQLQRQEYVAALNFERAGQDWIGAISILPGAATLYRREVLLAHPFSARTRTEDADLTLNLARRGIRIALATNAVASTVVPGTWSGLIEQRLRWTAGHLQCCVIHAFQRGAAHWFFRAVVFPNFVLSTVMIGAGFAGMAAIVTAGRSSLLALEWLSVMALSVVLAYTQRGCSWILDRQRRPRLQFFLLEPFVMSIVSILCFIGALFSVLQEAVPVFQRRRA